MNEIKRYTAEHFGDFEMVENTQGEWVRWEDVEKLLRQIETLKNDVYAAGDAYYQVASKKWLETK